MKISIDQHVLLKPLEQADKFVSTKTIIPILTEVLLEATNEGLTITGGDGFQYLRTRVGIDDLQVIEPGTITLQSKKIVEIAKKIKGVIDIESKNNTEVLISGNRKNYEMKSLDPAEYPQFKSISGSSIIKMNGDSFNSLIKETAYAAYEKEDNPIITGLRVMVRSGKLSFVGTNRERLSYSSQNIDAQSEFTTVVGAKALNELSKLIPTKTEVELFLNESEFHAKTDEFTFYSRVLSGSYPDIDRLLINNFTTSMIVSKERFLDALEGAYIIVKEERHKLVRMTVSQNKIELKSKAVGVGKANEVIDSIEISGNDFQISFNGKYALEAVKSLSGENMFIGFTGAMSPIIFRNSDDEDDVRVLIPFRVSEDMS